jgi:hypothetical protein
MIRYLQGLKKDLAGTLTDNLFVNKFCAVLIEIRL